MPAVSNFMCGRIGCMVSTGEHVSHMLLICLVNHSISFGFGRIHLTGDFLTIKVTSGQPSIN
jgi:hypothetical protein